MTEKVKRNWTPAEDQKLMKVIQMYGKQWNQVANEFDYRDAKSCAYRYKRLEKQINGTIVKGPLGRPKKSHDDSIDENNFSKSDSEPDDDDDESEKVTYEKENAQLLKIAYELYRGDWGMILLRFPELDKVEAHNPINELL